MKNRFKFLKTLSEYKSVDYELKYMREVLEDAHIEFEKFYRQWCAERDIDIAELNKQNRQRVSNIFEKQEQGLKRIAKPTEKTERDFSHVFKSIAKKLHPDKLDRLDARRPQYEYDFKRATSAKEKGDWGVLFEIVEKYGMPMAGYEEAIDALLENIKKINLEIENHKKTYSWKLYVAESDEEKDNLVKSFLKQVFNWKE